MEVFQQEFLVPGEGLSARGLFQILQDVSAGQCAICGCGSEELKRQGLMWVVIRQYVRALRYPGPGERVMGRTWPGKTRHGMFPRYYQLRSPGGELLLSGSSLWAIVDRGSRRMIRPEDYGIALESLTTGEEERSLRVPALTAPEERAAFVVPEAYLDDNGHMNNTRYYDLAERCIGRSAAKEGLRAACTEYIAEALCGEELQLAWAREGERYTLEGAAQGPVFRMLLEY